MEATQELEGRGAVPPQRLRPLEVTVEQGGSASCLPRFLTAGAARRFISASYPNKGTLHRICSSLNGWKERGHLRQLLDPVWLSDALFFSSSIKFFSSPILGAQHVPTCL
jgi:hypothetical protein